MADGGDRWVSSIPAVSFWFADRCVELVVVVHFSHMEPLLQILQVHSARSTLHKVPSDIFHVGLDDANSLNKDRTQSYLVQHASATIVVGDIGRILSNATAKSAMTDALKRRRPSGQVALVCTMSEV